MNENEINDKGNFDINNAENPTDAASNNAVNTADAVVSDGAAQDGTGNQAEATSNNAGNAADAVVSGSATVQDSVGNQDSTANQADAASNNAGNVADAVVSDGAAQDSTGNTMNAMAASNMNYQNANTGRQSPPYYTETYKKPKGRKNGVLNMVLIAVLSSILGGGIVFAAIMFAAPALLPLLTGSSNSSQAVGTAASSNGSYQKIEITQSSSPVTAIAEKVSPSIVGIKVTIASQGQGFFFNSSQPSIGEGSGIIIRQDGYILTNNHVVQDALGANSNKLTNGSKIEVILPNQQNKTYPATVVGRDSQSDIAVIKIDATGLPVAELGDSDKVKTGEMAVAIGNPAGEEFMGSVTEGIISGLNRNIQMDNGDELTLIQTDAAINPGNSGGALCNSQGQVIGVNTVKIAATGYEGLGFAIPINHAKDIAQSLIDYTYVKGRPSMGVLINTSFPDGYVLQDGVPKGALVSDVTPLSAANKAGILPGDIITKLNGTTVESYTDLKTELNKHKAGEKISVEIYRQGTGKKTLEITLDEAKN